MCTFCFLLLTFITYTSAASQEPQYLNDTPPFELIALPYSTDALEPTISAQTLELHHGKHLNGYVNNLNRLISGSPYAQMSLLQIVVQSDSSIFDNVIFNNAGQLLNHNLYFTQFTPQSDNYPQGMLQDAILSEWGSFENFKSEFNRNGAELFGSGWVWLAADHEGKLYIVQEPNGGNPITKGLIPLLGIDVWEHAYYLDYQNRRSEHLDALWNIIDWRIIEERYEASGAAGNNCQETIKEPESEI
ncbi:MAG: superoxide dismutase [Bacteroidaceae bacterium]|nr:superoxide dismutase [Bacteroidaceae bacterium]